MVAFHFRLESVLRFREQVRRERKWELGALEQTCEYLTAEIGGLEELLIRESKKLDEQQGEILSVTDLRTQADYCSGLVQSIQKKRFIANRRSREMGNEARRSYSCQPGGEEFGATARAFTRKAPFAGKSGRAKTGR